MPTEAVLIYPHQLFKEHPALKPGRLVVLVEEPLFFTQYAFHRQKLLFHMASMAFYRQWLENHHYQTLYVKVDELSSTEAIALMIKSLGILQVFFADPVDDWLEQRLTRGLNHAGLKATILPSPGFLNTQYTAESVFAPDKKTIMSHFYVAQRKQRRILLEPDNRPVGGKWSFDEENRKKIPKGMQLPTLPSPNNCEWVIQSRKRVQQEFSSTPGSDLQFFYPVTFEQASQWLECFLHTRLQHFGPYEDAIASQETMLFHSILSPLINVGLLTPAQVLERSMIYCERNDLPLSSLEGFVRQVMGWREFMRLAYIKYGRRARTTNFWGHQRLLPKAFWSGNTGIFPIDQTIKKVLQHAYCHHIERLMVLGCFMLLCDIHPDDVYRWFMELFIDAYDWVMVPNVYCMSQFAEGGLITTKPYLCGSNYILKMSDYKKGPWAEVWDGLYWRFLHKHQDMLRCNPRWAPLLYGLTRQSQDKLKDHLFKAESFLSKIQ
ncbi:MAG: cryptochrome/photolyase family protein [Parachlamydia sp.]|nr:cryptochrome/photolyase family protein [Parachlamydia sp.]